MILNVIRESDYTNNNTISLVNVTEEEQIQLKKIKELININNLKYVSDNVKKLLGLKIENDTKIFTKNPDIKNMRVNGIIRVILYVRLSQEDGDLQDGDVSSSIKNQLLYLLEECNKKNWVVVGIFCEEDLSGVDDNRPEWLRAIKCAECGNTEIILSKSQSRFTRSMEMVEKYLHNLFPEWGVRFIGLTDNIDSNDKSNKKSRQINALVNEWYVEDASINTRAALNAMKRSGQFTGNTPPYGYLIDPKDKHHLIPDLYAREIVKKMYEMLMNGQSLKAVADKLNEEGILTPSDYKESRGDKVYRGRNPIKFFKYKVERYDTMDSIINKFHITVDDITKYNLLPKGMVGAGQILLLPYKKNWTSKMVRKIVTDEVQIGTLAQGKTERISFKNKKQRIKPRSEWIIVPHCHEANIDKETFDKVCSKFQAKTRARPQKDGTIPLFSKKVFCPICGRAYNKNSAQSSSSKDAPKNGYLVCGGHIARICDNKYSIEENELKDYVLKQIQNKLNTWCDSKKTSDSYCKQKNAMNIDNEMEQLEQRKQKLNTDISKKECVLSQLYEDKVSGILSTDEFLSIKNKNTLYIDNLKKEIKEIESKIKNLELNEKQEKNIDALFEKYKDLNTLNRIILDEFVSRIEVGIPNLVNNERTIKIVWNLFD